jgi:hypothetical protein
MNASPTFAGPTGYPPRTRFVLVNDRVPRTDASCAQCRAKIESGYVRAPRTRLLYCDTQCFALLIAVSSLGGFRTPAAGVRGTGCERPASETLHRSGHLPIL